MPNHPFSEQFFPNMQSKPSLVLLEVVSFCPITCYLGYVADLQLCTISYLVESILYIYISRGFYIKNKHKMPNQDSFKILCVFDADTVFSELSVDVWLQTSS